MARKPITDPKMSKLFMPKTASTEFEKLYSAAVSNGVKMAKAKANQTAGQGRASYSWGHNVMLVDAKLWEDGAPNPPWDVWISTTHELVHAYEWNVTWRQAGKTLVERYNWHTGNMRGMTEMDYINTMVAAERRANEKGTKLVLDYLVTKRKINAADRERLIKKERGNFEKKAVPFYTRQFREWYRNFPPLSAFRL